MTCGNCGAENREGRKFCSECGSALALLCGSCGAANEAGEKFCGECGSPLMTAPVAPAPAVVQPSSERRLVSVMFADLVGFTSASEGRDAEETRELLSRYFETARTLIERYGGTVEKFIGDAVMAVWGTPVAQEDDAERAVRTALDLVALVPELDGGLQARAGVLTGEAAVTIGASGQGMVAGDLVNTASRIQSASEPGSVLVGDATKRVTEAAVAYEDAGEHALKGKAEEVTLWRALRVTAARGGAQRSTGLEPPFVGRDRELRLVKELFHATEEERRSQLMSVIGAAGIGKSRLGWEFEKYVDGLVELVYWHRGRCLAYGEGVAYWALAEMVRMRAGIVEGETRDSALAKLHETLDQYVPEADERRFVEPRLAHLLGLEDGGTWGKDELFGAWRVLFERLAGQGPVVLLFEDLQWADASLVEFIAYLLEWSRGYPIFVLCLARPELVGRHPEFGQGGRQTTLSLNPLSQQAMEQLLDGFVPGLPAELKERILARAEGVPLYAVETIRMLLDRGLVVREGGVYRATGAVGELDVPETLQGLIAARLDGLAPEERRLLQDAAVLGKTFTREALAALAGLDEPELDPLLASLVRKEVLGVQADPRSPERGQYGFLQDLVRRVAYDTLARRERRARHLAAASQLEAAFGTVEAEIVEVVASHYVAAYEAQPDADDAGEIKERARALLSRAGDRAGSLAAAGEARRYYEQAAALADDPLEHGRLLEQAGRMAQQNVDYDDATRLFTEALVLLETAGEAHAAARVQASLASVEYQTGHIEAALERLDAAFKQVAGDEPDADVAEMSARFAQLLVFAGEYDRALEPTDFALRVAQEQRLPSTVCRAMLARGIAAQSMGRTEEALALLRHALRHALENDRSDVASVAYGNLADVCFQLDRYGEALDLCQEELALARRMGLRRNELFSLSELSYVLTMLGRWDEALASYAEIPEEAHGVGTLMSPLNGVLEIHLHQERPDGAEQILGYWSEREGTSELQARACIAGAQAAFLFGTGRHAEALDAGLAAAEIGPQLSWGQQGVKQGVVWGVDAALALGETARADEMLNTIESLPPGLRPPFLEAQCHRFRARMSGDPAGFKAAAGGFREYGFPFWLAVTQLEHAEALESGPDAERLLGEARETFVRLGAVPWLERCDGAEARLATLAAPAT